VKAARPTPALLARRVESALAAGQARRGRLTADLLQVEGFSTPQIRYFLNALCARPDTRYLEVGTWKGSTLLAASFRNPGRFRAIDDFSAALQARETFQANRLAFQAECRVDFHELDCWSAEAVRKAGRDNNVYFYDGPHSVSDQYQAFTYYDRALSGLFIAIVDDWNFQSVRQGTRWAFADLGYRVHHEREIFTRRWLKDGWWNGFYVAVVEKAARARAGAGARRPGRAAAAPSRGRTPAPAAPRRGPRRRRAARATSR